MTTEWCDANGCQVDPASASEKSMMAPTYNNNDSSSVITNSDTGTALVGTDARLAQGPVDAAAYKVRKARRTKNGTFASHKEYMDVLKQNCRPEAKEKMDISLTSLYGPTGRGGILGQTVRKSIMEDDKHKDIQRAWEEKVGSQNLSLDSLTWAISKAGRDMNPKAAVTNGNGKRPRAEPLGVDHNNSDESCESDDDAQSVTDMAKPAQKRCLRGDHQLSRHGNAIRKGCEAEKELSGFTTSVIGEWERRKASEVRILAHLESRQVSSKVALIAEFEQKIDEEKGKLDVIHQRISAISDEIAQNEAETKRLMVNQQFAEARANHDSCSSLRDERDNGFTESGTVSVHIAKLKADVEGFRLPTETSETKGVKQEIHQLQLELNAFRMYVDACYEWTEEERNHSVCTSGANLYPNGLTPEQYVHAWVDVGAAVVNNFFCNDNVHLIAYFTNNSPIDCFNGEKPAHAGMDDCQTIVLSELAIVTIENLAKQQRRLMKQRADAAALLLSPAAAALQQPPALLLSPAAAAPAAAAPEAASSGSSV